MKSGDMATTTHELNARIYRLARKSLHMLQNHHLFLHTQLARPCSEATIEKDWVPPPYSPCYQHRSHVLGPHPILTLVIQDRQMITKMSRERCMVLCLFLYEKVGKQQTRQANDNGGRPSKAGAGAVPTNLLTTEVSHQVISEV